MDENILEFHIVYEEPLTLDTIARLLDMADEVFDSALSIYSIKHEDMRDALAGSAVRVQGVQKGSIIFDLLMPGLISIGANVLSELIVSIFKKVFDKAKQKQKPSFTTDGSEVKVNVPNGFKVPSKSHWTDEEETLVAKKAVDVYVLKKSVCSPDDFVMDPDFIDIIMAHGIKSLYLKLRNIRFLLDREEKGNHTLVLPPLSHCSSKNEKAVMQCLKDIHRKGTI